MVALSLSRAAAFCLALSFMLSLGCLASAQDGRPPPPGNQNTPPPAADAGVGAPDGDIEASDGDIEASDIEAFDGDIEASDGDIEAFDGDIEASDADVDEPDGEGEMSTRVPEELGLESDEMWIFVDKSERRMVVNDGRGWREAFHVALGQTPERDKRCEGDGRTPEGEYYVCRRIKNARFHRFLGLSYPNPADAERNRRRQKLQPIEVRAIRRAHRNKTMPPWRTPLGGNIGIHGYGRRRDCAVRHGRGEDWTDGCIAVTNEEIARIWDHTRMKTKVVIVP